MTALVYLDHAFKGPSGDDLYRQVVLIMNHGSGSYVGMTRRINMAAHTLEPTAFSLKTYTEVH